MKLESQNDLLSRNGELYKHDSKRFCAWVDDGSPMDVVYSNCQQKTFDKEPHQRVLIKLKAYCVRERMISWIQMWLTDRRQRVIVEGEISNLKPVLSGGPQCLLRTMIFLISINDLDDDLLKVKYLNGKVADDTNVFRTVKHRCR